MEWIKEKISMCAVLLFIVTYHLSITDLTFMFPFRNDLPGAIYKSGDLNY